MALGKDVSSAATQFSQLPVMRQLGILAGLAASVAIGVAVVIWAQKPEYRPLYHSLNGGDTIGVVDALDKIGIKHRLNHSNGSVLVPRDEVYEARMELAKEGLPNGNGKGFEILEQSQGLGTSQFVESARYRHALEEELARTITVFQNIHSARVHLAIPKQASFVRQRKKPSASVMIQLNAGKILDNQQIAAITHLVASSVETMQADQVTIVDGSGHLLSQGGGMAHMAVVNDQLAYIQQLEKGYVKQIENILAPLLGPNNFKAQVSAKVDFTHIESTKEFYDPDKPSLRSIEEQSESSVQSLTPGGIPGTLSHQPPVTTVVRQVQDGQADQSSDAMDQGMQENREGAARPRHSREHLIRNYEIDKTISHTKEQPWRIEKISVAVAVNDKEKIDPETKQLISIPRTEKEMDLITKLVKDTIGYDQERGDRVTVLNTSFAKALPIEPIPEDPFWHEEWFYRLMKQVISGLFVLILVFGVLRPMMKNLVGPKKMRSEGHSSHSDADSNPSSNGDLIPSYSGAEKIDQADKDLNIPPAEYEKKLQAVKNMVGNDPKRVAQVVRSWVEEE